MRSIMLLVLVGSACTCMITGCLKGAFYQSLNKAAYEASKAHQPTEEHPTVPYHRYEKERQETRGEPGSLGASIQLLNDRDEVYQEIAQVAPPGADLNATRTSMLLNGFACENLASTVSCEGVSPAPRWRVILSGKGDKVNDIVIVDMTRAGSTR